MAKEHKIKHFTHNYLTLLSAESTFADKGY